MAESYDLIVIGAGPGGYVAAIRAAQLGLRVAMLEKRETLGGTCLNVGCIPSKALLDSSELYYQARHEFDAHGIGVGDVSLDFGKLIARKNDVVKQTVGGLDYLFKKHKIARYHGTATFLNAASVKVANGQATKELVGTNIVIATGSEPIELPFAPFDETHILSSTGALDLDAVPRQLAVIGGGYIGLEMGSVYARLGSEVTVIELLEGIVPAMDREVAKALQRVLKKQGLSFKLGTRVTAIEVKDGHCEVATEDKQGKAETVSVERVLIAVGRRPNTDGLGLEVIDVQCNDRGFIEVDERFNTNVDGVFAIGDVIARGPMLAHKAEEEGVAVAELIAGHEPEVDYATIPGVVYTCPEVATVGRSEEQLKEAGVSYKVGKFPFKASGRARAANTTEGFVKVLADAQTDEVLGVHMLGPRASDMIAEVVLAMGFHASAEDIGLIVHAHPTFTEAVKEAALDLHGRAIHI